MLKNKIENSFGPSGSFAGKIVFIAGLVMLYFSWSALFLVVLGAFIGFSHTKVFIDTEKKRVKFSNALFGIILTGQWIDVAAGMCTRIKKSDTVFRTFSLTNRSISSDSNSWKVMLCDQNQKDITPLLKAETKSKAEEEAQKISTLLNIFPL